MKGKLFHIIRDREVKVGDEFIAGDEYNFFAKRLFSEDFSIDYKDINELVIGKVLNTFNEVESKMTKKYIYESCAIIRELVLELYRALHKPEYPSRLKCLFACETLQEAKEWLPILERMSKSKSSAKIVELEVEGKIFKGDGSLMTRSTHSVFEKFELAKKYWEASTQANEILFVGKAKVVNIFE